MYCVNIASKRYNPYGSVYLRVDPQKSDFGEFLRRYSMSTLLDGGTVITEGGVSYSGRKFKLVSKHISDSTAEILLFLHRNFGGELKLSTDEGLFNVCMTRLKIDADIAYMDFIVISCETYDTALTTTSSVTSTTTTSTETTESTESTTSTTKTTETTESTTSTTGSTESTESTTSTTETSASTASTASTTGTSASSESTASTTVTSVTSASTMTSTVTSETSTTTTTTWGCPYDDTFEDLGYWDVIREIESDASIVGNELKLTINNHSSANVTLYSKFRLLDDNFDFSIDMTGYVPSGSTALNFLPCICERSSPTINLAYIHVRHESGTTKFSSKMVINGVNYATGDTIATPTAFRFVRSGTTITLYYSTGGGWISKQSRDFGIYASNLDIIEFVGTSRSSVGGYVTLDDLVWADGCPTDYQTTTTTTTETSTTVSTTASSMSTTSSTIPPETYISNGSIYHEDCTDITDWVDMDEGNGDSYASGGEFYFDSDSGDTGLAKRRQTVSVSVTDTFVYTIAVTPVYDWKRFEIELFTQSIGLRLRFTEFGSNKIQIYDDGAGDYVDLCSYSTGVKYYITVKGKISTAEILEVYVNSLLEATNLDLPASAVENQYLYTQTNDGSSNVSYKVDYIKIGSDYA